MPAFSHPYVVSKPASIVEIDIWKDNVAAHFHLTTYDGKGLYNSASSHDLYVLFKDFVWGKYSNLFTEEVGLDDTLNF